MRGEIMQHRLVFGTQRSHSERRPIAQPLRGFEMLRIGCDGQLCRTWPIRRRDAQPRIQGDDAGRVSKQRIDVQLSDLRVIGSQLAEANQYFGDSLDFCGWLATISLQ